MLTSLGKRRMALLALVISVLSVPASAFAEQLVMPFECSAAAGVVRLRPSEQRTYGIYGQRQRQVFNICAPADPNSCRNIMIHRFQIDCGGSRVPWLRIVEAASRFSGSPIWIRGGQMQMEANGPSTSADRREAYPRPRFWREPPSRYRDVGPYDGGQASGTVSLPPGFAPTLGLPMAFIDGPGPNEGPYATNGDDGQVRFPEETRQQRYAGDPPYLADAAPTRPYPTGNDAPGWQESPRGTPIYPVETDRYSDATPPRPRVNSGSTDVRADRQLNEFPASDARSQSALTPNKKVEKPERSDKPTKLATAPAVSQPISPPSSAPTASANAAPAGSVTPKLINGSNEPAPAATTHANNVTASSKSAPVEATKPVDPTLNEPRKEERVAGLDDARAPQSSIIPNVALGANPKPVAFNPLVTWIAVSGGTAVLLALAYFAFMRREPASIRNRGVYRDLGNVSFERAPTNARAVVPYVQRETAVDLPVLETPPPAPPTQPPAQPEPPAQAAPDAPTASDAAPPAPLASTHVPSNLKDAYGAIGTNADASTDAIKIIVAGLRQSWHPDLAKSPDDRTYREARMRQINAAWDIIIAHRRLAGAVG